MIPYGELRDRETADLISAELKAKNIEAGHFPNPNHPEFFVLFVKEEKDLKTARDLYRVHMGLPPQFEMPAEWEALKRIPLGQITLFLLAFSVGVFILTLIPSYREAILDLLFISRPGDDHQLYYEMRNGEWWRAFTPMFLHFGLLHILFNSLWLKDLGSAIEFEEGKLRFLWIVLISALLSNNAQYLTIGPQFGGLSGVVFALLGHVWIKKLFYPESQIALPKNDVIFMVAWFFICMTGLFGPIANMAHGVGLSVGMITGIYSGLKLSNFKMESKTILKIMATIVGAIAMSALAFTVEWYKASGELFYRNYF
jgi:GlpG protein